MKTQTDGQPYSSICGIKDIIVIDNNEDYYRLLSENIVANIIGKESPTVQVAAVVQYFCHRWRCHSITQHHIKPYYLNPKNVPTNFI